MRYICLLLVFLSLINIVFNCGPGNIIAMFDKNRRERKNRRENRRERIKDEAGLIQNEGKKKGRERKDENEGEDFQTGKSRWPVWFPTSLLDNKEDETGLIQNEGKKKGRERKDKNKGEDFQFGITRQ